MLYPSLNVLAAAAVVNALRSGSPGSPNRLAEPRRDVRHLLAGEMRVHRQRHDLLGRLLGLGEQSVAEVQIGEARLHVERDRVVQAGRDAVLVQMGTDALAV